MANQFKVVNDLTVAGGSHDFEVRWSASSGALRASDAARTMHVREGS
jgi:hypothetical protein